MQSSSERIAELEVKLDKADASLKNITRQFGELQELLEIANTGNASHVATIKGLESRLDAAETRARLRTEDKIALQTEFDALVSRLDACQSSRVWLQEQLDIEQKRSAELEAQLATSFVMTTQVATTPCFACGAQPGEHHGSSCSEI